jgi:hypothetical protein
MNRRNALGNMVMLSLGVAVLPSCGQDDKAALKLNTISISGNEEKLLINLAETIIPKMNSFGATDIMATGFVLKMVDDCYDPEQQKKFTKGLKAFDKITSSQYGSSFTKLAEAQKSEWLTVLEEKKNIREDVQFFYETTKRHTLQAFTSSKEYMTSVLKYQMVPGSNFKGCVPINKV